ncbi:MAG: hypothetical protein IJ057_07745 [Bacteroidales bacterium]|nr:hypothetical protein [Bacteroidales bacterium]
MKNKHLILMALAVALTSCVKTKDYYVNDNNRKWFADTTNSRFTMQDENGISYSFRLDPMRQDMLENSASFLWVTTEKSMHEALYQSGFTSYTESLRFSLAIEAYKCDDEHEGTDLFMMYLGEASYRMRIDGDHFYPQGCYDSGYNVDKMDFEAEYIDQYWVHDVEYDGVMHLKLIDLAYPKSKFFPTEIFYAKHYGLIQVTLDDRLTLYRLQN